MALLAMGAGLLLPELAGWIGRTRLDRETRRLELLCRESWSSAVFSGRSRVVRLVDGRLEVRDGGPSGPTVDRLFLEPHPLPGWCEVTGLDAGWWAAPEGFCDPGPLEVRDRETGERHRIRFRPYDGEVEPE